MVRFPKNRSFIDIRLLLLLLVLAAGCLLLAGGRVRGILLTTAWLSIAVAALAVPIGSLAALLLVKTDAWGRRIWLAGFGVLLFMPLYLHVAGWQAAFGVTGWMTLQPEIGLARPLIDGWLGAVWVHAMAAVPAVVWIVAAGLRRLPVVPEEEASLVASPWQVLRAITLPAVAPAMAVAALWVMVSVATEMTVTDFFQVRTFAEEVYTEAAAGGFQTDNPTKDYQPWQPWLRATGLIGGVGLLATLTLLLLMSGTVWLSHHPAEVGERARGGWVWQLGKGRALGGVMAAAIMLLIAGLPVVSLIHQAGLGAIRTGDSWQRFWSWGKLWAELSRAAGLHSRELWQTWWLGLAVATASTLLGLLAAWWYRQQPYRPSSKGASKGLGLVLLSLALSVPGPLLGLAAIYLLNHPVDSFFYRLTIAYDQTLLAPWLVQTVRFTPVATLVIAAGLASVPRSLLDAAQTDGAGWWGRLLWIALPLRWPMVAAAWLITFALSSGDLATTVLVMPPGPPTLAIRLFGLLHYGVEDQVAAISLVLLGGVSLLAAVAIWLMGRSVRENCFGLGRR